jgi:hypothetical protein
VQLLDQRRATWHPFSGVARCPFAFESVAKSCATFRFVIHDNTPPASVLTDSTIGRMEASGEAAAERP